MSRYISETLRTFVAQRAKLRCEYCLLDSTNSFFSFHIDHIISLKHGGKTTPQNLAFACPICNVNKGSDIGTFTDNSESIIRFFNPRTDNWNDHFSTESSGCLTPKTNIGEATIKILDLNHPDSIIERRELIRFGLFSS